MKDLIIIILTFNLEEIVKPARYLPKVCHFINGKTMIEICLEKCLRLNPMKIILYVSKNNIQCINKVLKHSNYAKMLSFCIYDNELNGPRRLTIGQRCFRNKNLLLLPGNCPLLSTKTLFRVISEGKNIKIQNNFFYLKKDSLNLLDKIDTLEVTDMQIVEMETKQVETRGDLEDVEKFLEEMNVKKKKYFFSRDVRDRDRDKEKNDFKNNI